MTTAARALPTPTLAGRPWSVAKASDLVLAAVAHALVFGSWAVTAAALMGSLAIPRRIVMNSEWALDFGRLPQPWVIPIGLVAVLISHRLFRWTMARYTGGKPAYGPSVIAWVGVLAGVAYGAYVWQPPVQVGQKVGPASGQSTRWDAVAYVAYYARLWLPALVALVTGVLFLVSRQSPWRAFWAARRRARANRNPRRVRASA